MQNVSKTWEIMLNLGNGILYFSAQYVFYVIMHISLSTWRAKWTARSINIPHRMCVFSSKKSIAWLRSIPLQGALNMLVLRSLDMAFSIRVTRSFCLPFTIEIVNLWLFGKTVLIRKVVQFPP